MEIGVSAYNLWRNNTPSTQAASGGLFFQISAFIRAILESEQSATTSAGRMIPPFVEDYSTPNFINVVGRRARATSYSEASVPELVKAVLDYFGLSKSDLAKILGVTRPTLYAWLDGQSEPNVENVRRLSDLASVIEENEGEKQPLFHAYIERVPPGGGMTLISALSEDKLDRPQIRSMVKKIRAMTVERNERIGRKQVSEAASPSRDSKTLEDNLLAIGLED